jgi:hypothetical protein
MKGWVLVGSEGDEQLDRAGNEVREDTARKTGRKPIQ